MDNVGKYVDYLLKDGKTNTSRIVDKSAAGAKRAELEYQILEEKEQGDGAVRSLVEIHLHTGRHHQIRVQFAAHGTPLVGDTKYGAPAAASGAVCGSLVVPSPGDRRTDGIFHRTAVHSVSEVICE